MPDAVDPRLRAALERRGIARLYSHQAEAFDHLQADRNVVIVTPTASGKTLCYNLPVLNALLRRRERPRHVPVSHQGAGRRPAARVSSRRGRDGLRHPRLHLRWRYAAGRPQGHPPARQRRAHQSRHAALGHPAAPHPVGAIFRKPALHRDRRAALLPRRLRQPPGEPAAPPAADHASFTVPSRSSSAARPPSPIRANWPKR